MKTSDLSISAIAELAGSSIPAPFDISVSLFWSTLLDNLAIFLPG